MSFEIRELRGVEVVIREDGLYDVNVELGVMTNEVNEAIEFSGYPWQEGLTEEELHNLRVGGYSVDDLVSESR